MTSDQIEKKHRQGGGHGAPWLLASACLASQGTFTLSADELFDVVRWYAHNRGYDGNRRWARNAPSEDDTARELSALALMDAHGTSSMAETISAHLGLSPNGHLKASQLSYKNPEVGAAFPREVVAREVDSILRSHVNVLDGCDDAFVTCVCGNDDGAWKTIPLESVRKPKSFAGSLLFGQKVPRFDNRVLSFCPITNKPTPLKSTSEFTSFRCAMFLSNVVVQTSKDATARPLNGSELQRVWAEISKRGYLTAKAFRNVVREGGPYLHDNVEALLTIDDAVEALVLDPVSKLISSNKVLSVVWKTLPPDVAVKMSRRLRKKHALTLADIHELVDGNDSVGFRQAVDTAFQKDTAGKRKFETVDRWMQKKVYAATFPSGRAPYSRSVMKEVVQQVLSGIDPRHKGGCLYLTDEVRDRLASRSLAQLTNNHLVRHRLLILDRLLDDLVREYASGNRERVHTVVVECNREVSEMSGKTAKQIKQEEGLKRADHKKTVKELEEAIQESGENVQITAGLIRKARVARDLDWTCPYTGQKYDELDLIHKSVDLDHIIPRSERLSDAMSGMVVTFSEVNRWKGKRTAWQFIKDEQSKPVPGTKQLSIRTLSDYEKAVRKLKTFGGSTSDEARRKNRRKYLLTPSYTEKEFTPRDLTVSSYVTKLALQRLRHRFSDLKQQPKFVALPGRLTGEARKAWDLLGLLTSVNADIGPAATKSEVRERTQMHHALDAIVMGLLAHYVRDIDDGTTWQLLLKRNLGKGEATLLRRKIPLVGFDSSCRPHLKPVPLDVQKNIRDCLLQRRVVQHIPASMDGLRVEENVRGVVGVDSENGKATLRQGKKTEDVLIEKLLGLSPAGGEGKLAIQKGVRVINMNFGVALTSPPQIITWHAVMQKLKAIARRHDGRFPDVLRNGMVIHVPEGHYFGVWKVFSIKNNAAGLAVDMGFVDSIHPHRINVRLNSLLDQGMTIVSTTLGGEGISRITSSILTVPTPE